MKHDIINNNHDHGSNLELIHDQLPLAVPCYDLLPVTEFTLVLDKLSLWVPPAPLS